MLTAKQEKFVRELIKGKSQREAYKAAYRAENMKDNTIDCKASLLLKKDYVRERYDELRAEVTNESVEDAANMRAFIIKTLQDIASGEICDETVEYDAEGQVLRKKKTIKASDRRDALNKLAEYYNVTPDASVQHEVNVVFSNGLEGYCE